MRAGEAHAELAGLAVGAYRLLALFLAVALLATGWMLRHRAGHG
jgi:hypothetical protein